MLVLKTVHIFGKINKHMQIIWIYQEGTQMDVQISEFFSKSTHDCVHIFKNFPEYMHQKTVRKRSEN